MSLILTYKQLKDKNDTNKQNYEKALLAGSNRVNSSDVINVIDRENNLLKIRKNHKNRLIKYTDVENMILNSKYAHTDELGFYIGFYNLINKN
jgi:hypothetical protein